MRQSLDITKKACLHSKQRFSHSEWEVSSQKGYTFTVIITEGELYCTCNLPQLQKLPCAHVIAACSNESSCTDISTYSLCAFWYSVDNYCKFYALKFLHVPDAWFSLENTVDYYISPLMLEGHRVTPFRSHTRGMYGEREGHRWNICSNCKKLGHNKARCPNPPAPSSSIG